MAHVTLKRSETGRLETFYIDSQSARYDEEGNLASFFAFGGTDQDGHAIFFPYYLKQDTDVHFNLMRALIDASKIAVSTAAGAKQGANKPHSIKLGPGAMRSNAIHGGQTGFLVGTAWTVAGELFRYAAPILLGRTYYYVSPTGAPYHGPISRSHVQP